MFRQEELFVGGWRDKTLESMQKHRLKRLVAQMPPIETQRLHALSAADLARRIERSWQSVERKPMKAQQTGEVWRAVLRDIELQADCLSRDEHELVDRALILGGGAQIGDMREMEAARALALRLWASVGLLHGKPYIELETPVLRPAARAFARAEHQEIRRRFETFDACLGGAIYRAGAIDDRYPQQMIVKDVLGGVGGLRAAQLARCYLWAGYDCLDYHGGVMLVHPALAEPGCLFAGCARRSYSLNPSELIHMGYMDILPEEIPLQKRLEYEVAGALRDGYRAEEAASSIRLLCKQGAPLWGMEEVLQSMLIVLLTPSMRDALRAMYDGIPKWIECAERVFIQ